MKNKAVLKLISILETSSSLKVNVGAVKGLGFVGGEAAVEKLIQVIDETSSLELKTQAVEALGRAASKI